MASLNISKVAVGCPGVEALEGRQRARLADGVVPIVTRFRPKRAEELVGGSIFWILQHRFTVRQEIVGFAENQADRRTIIKLDPRLVPVRPQPRRAHQGWRYLLPQDAPADLAEGDGLASLPAGLSRALAGLALI